MELVQKYLDEGLVEKETTLVYLCIVNEICAPAKQ